MKKLSLIALCGAAAMFSACGDDDSSSASNVPAKDAEGRTVYTDMQSALEAPCTEANQCEVIILNDPIVQDTMICIGTAFQSVLGKTFAQCAATPASSSDAAAPASSDAAVAGSSSDAAAAPASSDAATPASSSDAAVAPATDTPAAQGPTVYTEMSKALSAPCSEENKCEIIILNSTIAQDTLQCNGSSFQSLMGKANLPVCEEAAAADTPATEPAASEAGPTGSLVSCDFVAEGVLGEHSCVEAVASDVVVPVFCQTMGSMGEGMTATTGTGCNAPETALKCVKNGMNFYSLDGKNASCDAFFEASVLQGLGASL